MQHLKYTTAVLLDYLVEIWFVSVYIGLAKFILPEKTNGT
jgi:hypothetical protein